VTTSCVVRALASERVSIVKELDFRWFRMHHLIRRIPVVLAFLRFFANSEWVAHDYRTPDLSAWPARATPILRPPEQQCVSLFDCYRATPERRSCAVSLGAPILRRSCDRADRGWWRGRGRAIKHRPPRRRRLPRLRSPVARVFDRVGEKRNFLSPRSSLFAVVKLL
jgi:hypothetical protein